MTPREGWQERTAVLEAALAAGQWIVRLGGRCKHPESKRIYTLSGPGSFTCLACGYALETADAWLRGELKR